MVIKWSPAAVEGLWESVDGIRDRQEHPVCSVPTIRHSASQERHFDWHFVVFADIVVPVVVSLSSRCPRCPLGVPVVLVVLSVSSCCLYCPCYPLVVHVVLIVLSVSSRYPLVFPVVLSLFVLSLSSRCPLGVLSLSPLSSRQRTTVSRWDELERKLEASRWMSSSLTEERLLVSTDNDGTWRWYISPEIVTEYLSCALKNPSTDIARRTKRHRVIYTWTTDRLTYGVAIDCCVWLRVQKPQPTCLSVVSG